VSIIRHWFSTQPTDLLLPAESSRLRSDQTGYHNISIVVVKSFRVLVLILRIFTGNVFSALMKGKK
jgi:hypothetical protein